MARTNTPLEARRSPFKPVRGHKIKSSLLKQGTHRALQSTTRRVLIISKFLKPLTRRTSPSNVHHTGSNPSENPRTIVQCSLRTMNCTPSEKSRLNPSYRRTAAVMSATALPTHVSSVSSTSPTSPTVLAKIAANWTATLKVGMTRRLSSRNSRTSQCLSILC